MIKQKSSIILLFVFALSSQLFYQCSDWDIKSLREEISLEGEWQMQLDEELKGVQDKWFLQEFSDTVILPGSLDENMKGWLRKDSTYSHLNRPVFFYGKAFYRKEIEIPEEWKHKDVRLIMERTKVTEVWFDDQFVGTNSEIYSPQYYLLNDYISPGKHTITIAVDNREELVPVAGSHAYSENTQTNWNGIIGKFCLEARNIIHIESAIVTPDIHSKKVKLKFRITNREKSSSLLTVTVKANLDNFRGSDRVPAETFIWSSEKDVSEMEFEYDMGEDVKLWSEFDPALYKLEIVLNQHGVPVDNYVVVFGMREFKTEGTRFVVNDNTVFLRGKHDACVFPLTGYPPTTVKEWERVFKIAKDWGMNHYRYHSWTPPEAAFQAADRVGIYIQTELPMWWGFNAEDTVEVNYLVNQGKRILDEYANYASFNMMALGNELNQERNILKYMVDELKGHDSRPLFAQGSNNRLWAPLYAEGDDYFVSFRSKADSGDNSTDIRTSMSFLDSKHGGILNAKYPSTTYNFSVALQHSPVPLIGFEVGQYQVYPNFSEMPKYTGVLKPWNLELFKKDLINAGMYDQVEDFFKASGKLSALCYKADMEAAIRTPGFGGFHLLDLQDYPGQGTALVGMLDAFMDNKGILEPGKFRQSCDDIVVLAEIPKFCYDTTETFVANILIANYSSKALNEESMDWQLVVEGSYDFVSKGQVTNIDVGQGQVVEFAKIQVSLEEIEEASQLRLDLHLKSGNQNSYPVWVYPPVDLRIPEGVVVADELTVDNYIDLVQGGSVLLFPKPGTLDNFSIGCQFISDFWNYAMFKELGIQYEREGLSPGTMGLLIDPEHAAFEIFPTEFHTNYQWWSILKDARSLILDTLNLDYKPLVQVIDNINRNHKLSLVSEFKVGKGKLLVCTAYLPEKTNYVEAKQLYASILNYMASEEFNPEYELERKDLIKIGLMQLGELNH